MISRSLRFGALLLALAMPSPVCAYLARPLTLGKLIAASDTIAIGKVSRVDMRRNERSTLWWSVVVFVVGCGIHAVCRRRFRLGLLLIAGPILFSFLTGVLARPPSEWKSCGRRATLEIQEFLKGAPQGSNDVFFGSLFACDDSKLEAGKSYVLFLKRIQNRYALSWYQYAELEITRDLVMPSWNDEPDMSLQDLKDGVRLLVGSG